MTTDSLGKFLAVDPGEDTGWSVWNNDNLVDCGTTKMWDFSDAVWAIAVKDYTDCRTPLHGYSDCGIDTIEELPEDLQEVATSLDGIDRIVLENWQLYPWEAMKGNLNWDECRTARLIGSLYQACRFAGWEYEQQPAKIKERAVAAGAEAFFLHPLHENRHANDSIMHGVFRNAKQRGAPWADLSKKEFTA